MRNKVIAILLTVIMIFVLTACGKTETKDQNNNEEAVAKSTTVKVADGEEETVIGPGGTILHVKRVKDSKGKEILVEEVENMDGNTIYKQVIIEKDGSVKFADVTINEKGEYVTEKPAKPEKSTKTENGENYVDIGDLDPSAKKEKTTDKKKEVTTKSSGANGKNTNDDSGWSEMY